MNTFRVSVESLSEYSNLEFGERGENAVTRVLLDFTAWVEEFGAGVVNLYVKRGGDTSAYPVPLSIEGTVATWLVSDTDTYKMGRGEAEYVYVANEKVEKTAVFGFYVKKDIGQPSANPPSPYETWIESLMELSNTTLENAQDAEEWADKAEFASRHYPIIVENYWWVWRVEEDAYVNSGVKAEGQDFTIRGTVRTVEDLPETATQGTYYNVGEAAPYAIYMWQDGVGWMYQGQLQGQTGATFVPSISDEGVISWTNDGGLPNPEAKSVRGPQGIQGVKGETGDAAGFGQVTASVDANTGTPSVAVTASGPDTAKVFNFQFHNIKGERGEQGQTGATGGDGTTFMPSVSSEGVISWTNDGGKTNPQSVNIKGPQGERGATGQGVPTGGSAGQVLKKASATDYDTEWGDGGGGGGLYVVNVQNSGGTYTSDKTHKEITDALDAGYTVVVDHATTYYQLVRYDSEYSSKPVSFSRTNYSGGSISLFSLTISGGDNVNTFSYSVGSVQGPTTPQNPNPMCALYYDTDLSKYVFSYEGYTDFSQVFSSGTLADLPVLTYDKGMYDPYESEPTDANREMYQLTDAYTTHDGNNVYTGHVVFARVVVVGSTPKIQRFEISQEFNVNDDFATAAVTYSEVSLALGT